MLEKLPTKQCISGRTFGNYTVVEFAGLALNDKIQWEKP
jgi:hypothetical protein